MSRNTITEAIYQLLPRKVGGFFVVALISNPAAVQMRSASKQFCLDWLAENQPKQPETQVA